MIVLVVEIDLKIVFKIYAHQNPGFALKCIGMDITTLYLFQAQQKINCLFWNFKSLVIVCLLATQDAIRPDYISATVPVFHQQMYCHGLYNTKVLY